MNSMKSLISQWMRLPQVPERPIPAQGLCPICGERVHLLSTMTADGRLIGSCLDAFPLSKWME